MTATTTANSTGSGAPTKGVQKHAFQAEVSRVLRLVIDSLYTNKEIFLRELLSNASDALDKLRFRSVTEPELLQGDDSELRVRLIPRADEGVLEIEDNGIGMTAEELVQNLGTIAHSGSGAFLEKIEEAKKKDLELIGQFGVGFYSAFLVADKVEVITRGAGTKTAHRWVSEAKDEYTVEPADRQERGTLIRLHLKEDAKKFLDEYELRGLVRTYSDYLNYTVELQVEKKVEDQTEVSFDKINSGKPIWQRPASEVTDEQHAQFYKHLSADWEAPATYKQFSVEGTQEFAGIIYIPARPPMDLFMPDRDHGLKLYVKRVFVTDHFESLLPKWLRFIHGVVDSEDLPLNVSRETLQDSGAIRVIRKTVIRQTLDHLLKVAKDDRETFDKIWTNFGAVLKEGLHFDPQFKEKLADLVRYESSTHEGLVSLAEYVERMPEGQKAIYYALGDSRAQVQSSPHLEVLKKHGYEVLFMTDAVDQWAVQGLEKYKDLELVSATNADLKLDKEEEEKLDEAGAAIQSLRDRIRARLEERISEVRVSHRLTDSPVCLVVPEGGLEPHVERMLRAAQAGMPLPATKRILEVNPTHPLMASMEAMLASGAESKVDAWIDLLYQQALLAEGSPIENPAELAKQLTALLQQAASSESTEASAG